MQAGRAVPQQAEHRDAGSGRWPAARRRRSCRSRSGRCRPGRSGRSCAGPVLDGPSTRANGRGRTVRPRRPRRTARRGTAARAGRWRSSGSMRGRCSTPTAGSEASGARRRRPARPGRARASGCRTGRPGRRPPRPPGRRSAARPARAAGLASSCAQLGHAGLGQLRIADTGPDDPPRWAGSAAWPAPAPPAGSACPRAGRRRPACRSRPGRRTRRAGRRAAGTPRRARARSPSSAEISSGGPPAAAAPSSSGRCDGVLAGLVPITRSASAGSKAPRAWASMSRNCPATTSVRIRSNSAVAARRPRPAAGGRSRPGTSPPAQDSSRSPSRIAPAAPKRRPDPGQPARRCSRPNRTCAAGWPRRVSEASITSSCTSAQACSSSRLAAARISSASPSAPAGRHGPPAPVGERRPQPLAAVEHRRPGGVGQQRQVRRSCRPAGRRARSRKAASSAATSSAKVAAADRVQVRGVSHGVRTLRCGAWRARSGTASRPGRPTFSFEFFPPKTAEDERLLWTTIRELESLQPGLRLGHLRRRRRHPRPHHRDHRADRQRHHAAAGGAPDRGRALGRRAPVHRRTAGRRRHLQRAGAARRPARRPDGRVGRAPGGAGLRRRSGELVRAHGDFTVGVAAFPYKHPRSSTIEDDTAQFVAKCRRRRGLRDHPDVLRGRGLPAAARPGGRRRLRRADHRRADAGDQHGHHRALRAVLRRAVPGRAAAPGSPRSPTTRRRCGRWASSEASQAGRSGCWTRARRASTSSPSTGPRRPARSGPT